MKSILLIFTIFFVLSCSKDENKQVEKNTPEQDSLAKIRKDSIDLAKKIAAYETRFDTVKYLKTVIEDKNHLIKVKSDWKRLKEDHFPNKIFITLNRKERRYLRVGDTIVVPDTIISDLRAYSLFPQYYHAARDINKLIVVSNKYQCYACYENGELVRFAACNSGKERTPTFPGRYALTWKEKKEDLPWIVIG